MQASLTEVLALLVLALVSEKAVEVFDQGVVKFAGLFNQQKIDSGHSLRLGAESVNIHDLIPTKYVNGQVIQLLHFGGLRDGRGGLDPFEVEIVIGRILRRSVYMVTGTGPIGVPIGGSGHPFFHIDKPFWTLRLLKVGCKGSLTMADILQCPVRGSALGRPSTPTLSVSTFRAAPRCERRLRQEPL